MGEVRQLELGQQVAFGTTAGGGTTTVYIQNDSGSMLGKVKIEPVGITETGAHLFGFDYTEYEREVGPNGLIEIEIRYAGALARIINRGQSTLRVWTDA
jgi:hypothetical protein